MRHQHDINPGDLQTRRNLMRRLRATRHNLGIPLSELATDMWLTRGAVSRFELHDPPNPHITHIQRYARGLTRTIRLHLEGLPTDITPDVDDQALARLEQSPDPATADQAHRNRTLHRLVAARHHLHLPQAAVAATMGCHRSSLCVIERGGSDALLSTYQRYARALGGRLTVALRTEDHVDRVRVEQAINGADLTLSRNEKIAATRLLLRSGVEAGMVAHRLGVSGTTAATLVAWASEAAA